MENSHTTDDLLRKLANHPSHHVCKPNTRLVIEGYPRSSNSFAVDMLVLSAQGRLHRHELAHHTHEVANLKLADAYGIPKIILIRNPEDAILSFHIYSGQSVQICAQRYVNFYTEAKNYLENALVANFEDVTSNFREIVRRLNRIGKFDIPEDQDFNARREEALALVRSRAAKDDAEVASRQVAAPNAAREHIKTDLREAVSQFLAANPQANLVYSELVHGSVVG